jgi:hypothetical protein
MWWGFFVAQEWTKEWDVAIRPEWDTCKIHDKDSCVKR